MNAYWFRRAFALAFCLLCFIARVSPLATAAAATDDPLQGVVVTAARIPMPIDQVASSVTIMTAEEIGARQFRSLADLLKEISGLNVVQTGGPGGQTSLFMRGTNSNHTKVLIDGIDVGDPSNANGSFDFGQLPTADVQRVEVLRGPQSGLYGSDAVGGVVNVITQSGSGPAQFTGELEAGSFDTFNQSAGIMGAAARFHYAANFQHYRSGATPVTPADYLQPGQARIDDSYDNSTGSAKLGFDISDHLDLGLVMRYTDSHLRFTGDNFGFFPSIPNTAQSESDRRQYYSRATVHLEAPDIAFEQTLGAAYSNSRTRELTPNPSSEADNFGARAKFDWQGLLRLATDEKLVLGAEHERDEITTPISAGTSIDSGYAELVSTVWDSLYSTLAVRYDDNDRFGGKVTYRFAPEYLVDTSGTKLRASVGSGFKAPTLSELFQSFPDFGFFANPHLRPESSVGWDLGFEQDWTSLHLRLGVTYFRNTLKNLIDTSSDGTTYANIGRALTQGAESFVAYQPMESLTVRFDHTFTQATDEITHLALLRRPKHKESLNAAWQPTSRWSVNATVLSVSSWVDGNRDFSIPRLNSPSYTTVNLATDFKLTRHWTLTGRLANLFNRHYQNPDGFDQPTLGAFAGIKANF